MNNIQTLRVLQKKGNPVLSENPYLLLDSHVQELLVSGGIHDHFI